MKFYQVIMGIVVNRTAPGWTYKFKRNKLALQSMLISNIF